MFNLKKYRYADTQDASFVENISNKGDIQNFPPDLRNVALETQDNLENADVEKEEVEKTYETSDLKEQFNNYSNLAYLKMLQDKYEGVPEFQDLIVKLQAREITEGDLENFNEIMQKVLNGEISPEEQIAISGTDVQSAAASMFNRDLPLIQQTIYKEREARENAQVASSSKQVKKGQIIPDQNLMNEQNNQVMSTVLPVEDIGDFINKMVKIILSGDETSFNQAQSEIVSNVSADLEQEAQSAFGSLKEFLGRAEEEEEIASILTRVYGLLPSTQSSGEATLQEEPMMAKSFNLSKHSEKEEGLTKEAYFHVGDSYLMYGPTEKRICPKLRGRGGGKPGGSDVVSEEICRFHCLDGIIIDDNKTICGEALWRANVMDKFSREYVDKEGKIVGGYLNKRFEIDRNVAPENSARLKPGETRKPRPPELGVTESRMQAMRNKEGEARDYRPATNTGQPFNWQKDVDQNNVNQTQKERDRREEAMGHQLVQYTNKEQLENHPKMEKQAQVIPDDGYADGGEPYTDEEMDLMAKPIKPTVLDNGIRIYKIGNMFLPGLNFNPRYENRFGRILIGGDRGDVIADSAYNDEKNGKRGVFLRNVIFRTTIDFDDLLPEELRNEAENVILFAYESIQGDAFIPQKNANKPKLKKQFAKEAKGKKFIQDAVKDEGSFTEYCGGKVTQECIERGKKSPDTKTKRRANLAETLRGLPRKKKKAFNLNEYKSAAKEPKKAIANSPIVAYQKLVSEVTTATSPEQLDSINKRAIKAELPDLLGRQLSDAILEKSRELSKNDDSQLIDSPKDEAKPMMISQEMGTAVINPSATSSQKTKKAKSKYPKSETTPYNPWAVCFVPGTFVTMKDGTSVPIEKIKIGDYVISHRGNPQKVTKVFSRFVDEKLLKIQVNGVADKTIVTKDHPFFAMTSTRNFKGYAKDQNKNKTGKRWYSDTYEDSPKFIKARYLKKGDALHSPSINFLDRDVSLNINEQDAFVMGLYCAEGCLDRRPVAKTWKCGNRHNRKDTFVPVDKSYRIKFALNNFEDKFAINFLKKYSNNKLNIYGPYRSSPKAVYIILSSKSLYNLCEKHIGKYSQKKTLSNALMSMSPAILRYFLIGYFLGDANIERSSFQKKNNKYSSFQSSGKMKIYATSASRNLINQLFWICEKCGIVATTRKQKENRGPYNREKSYYNYGVELDATESCKLLPEFNKLKVFGDDILITPSGRKAQRFAMAACTYGKVISVSETDYSGKTYNLEVENDNTYVANLCSVHNCSESTGREDKEKYESCVQDVKKQNRKSNKQKKSKSASNKTATYGWSFSQDFYEELERALEKNILSDPVFKKGLEDLLGFAREGAYAEGVPVDILIDSAMEQAEQVNTVTDLSSPVEVWIDEEGYLTVEVPERDDFNYEGENLAKSFNLKKFKTAQMTGLRGPVGPENPISDDLGLSPDYLPDEDFDKEVPLSEVVEEYMGEVDRAENSEQLLKAILDAHKNWKTEGLSMRDLDQIMDAAYDRGKELGVDLEQELYGESDRVFEDIGIEGPPITQRSRGPRYFAKNKKPIKESQTKKKS